MSKKILCAIIAFAMIFSVAVMSGCSLFESKEETSDNSRLPITLNIIGITEETTRPEDILAVQDAINEITVAKYETKIILTLVTEDEYYDLVKARCEEAEYYQNVDAAIAQYNKYAERQAAEQQSANAGSQSGSGKWKRQAVVIEAETVATRPVYTSEVTTVDEEGIISVLYPDAASPVDVLMITGKDMYDEFTSEGILASISSLLTGGSSIDFQKFNQYIYPTYFSQLKAITGDINAVPTNNLLAEYTYVVVRKDLADKYSLNPDNISDYSDLADFLASVKASENVTPMNCVPEALGMYYPFGRDIAIATYFDPISGYSVEDGKSFTVSNLFDIPQYVNHLETIKDFTSKGYFEKKGDDFAVDVIKGDASIADVYDEDYYVQIVQNPFVEEQSIFDGMMAVCSYSSNAARALEIIQAFNTDPSLKNLLQYGIENVNYQVNEDGLTIKRLNDDYMMDTKLTGNLYMGYPDEGERGDMWAFYKKTNLASALSPFLICYINSGSFEENMSKVLKRAALSDALTGLDNPLTYDEYVALPASTYAITSKQLRLLYTDYLKECLIKEGFKDEQLIKTDADGNIYYKSSLLERIENAADAVYSLDWYNDRIVDKIASEKYADIITESGLLTLAQNQIASVVGVPYSGNKSFEAYRKSAATYYTNIKYLRIMSEMLLFENMSEEEIAKYDAMTDAEFESAILDYVTKNYIEENELDDEKYSTLVKTYLASMLTFTDNLGNSYVVSWDEMESARENATPFEEAVETLKNEYADLLAANYYDVTSASATPVAVAEKIHDLLYMQYLTDIGMSMAEFQNSQYDEILEPFGTTKAELDSLKTKSKSDYDAFVSKLKKKYKSILLETYSEDKLKETGTYALTTSDALTALLANKIEETTQIYHEMADLAGISYARFTEAKSAMTDYIKYVNMLRTKNNYTLTTVYTQSEVSNFKWNEIQQIVYDNAYSIGYYTNEMVKLVGSSLSDYMQAKSNATNYINALNKLVSYYSSDITARGYDIESFKTKNPEDVEDIIFDIINEKSVQGKQTLEQILKDASAEYVSGIETAGDPTDYCKKAFETLSSNVLFDSVVKTFRDVVAEGLSTEE